MLAGGGQMWRRQGEREETVDLAPGTCLTRRLVLARPRRHGDRHGSEGTVQPCLPAPGSTGTARDFLTRPRGGLALRPFPRQAKVPARLRHSGPMHATSNPYQALPPRNFWRSAVAQRGTPHFESLWTPRFPMHRGTRFATAGSCFAQHIGTWLKSHGHEWVDSEPAPMDMDEATRRREGHGVFSFRTGNIYTARLLRQWVLWALEIEAPPDEVIEQDGAWFDPFRPRIPAHGFPSAQAVKDARHHSLTCMRRALEQVDVLIFTLGLTEGWEHAAGHAYPACPGTLRGRFDAAVHRFVNQPAASVEAELDRCFDTLRARNPGLRFLLTVSPVPLTATATEAHVLVAATHSKAVLRAAAGALRERRPDVDYFPSYELITSSAAPGRFYDDNLRDVTADGVEFVMGHFQRGLGEAATLASSNDIASPAVTPAHPVRHAPADADAVCDDILLDTWNAHAAPAHTRVCLIGDSHMGLLSRAFSALGIDHAGGMIMNGSAWFENAFRLDTERFIEPQCEDDGARDRWGQTLPFLQGRPWRTLGPATVITNLAVHTHVAVPSFLDWHMRRRGHLRLGIEDSRQFFVQTHADKLAFAERLLRAGFRVIVVTDPPVQHLDPDNVRLEAAFSAYERLACSLYAELGAQAFLAREHFGGDAFDPAYQSTTRLADGSLDLLHGSDAYYTELARALAARFALAG